MAGSGERRNSSTCWVLALIVFLVSGVPAAAQDSEEITELEYGRRLFRRLCAECHGLNGDGYGIRHEITYARPRTFLTARFKFASTENGVPSDEDLVRTIRLGLPGSGMPRWSELDDDELLALARYVRHLGVEALRAQVEADVEAGELSAEEAAAVLERRTVPGPPVEVPPEPPRTDEGRDRGRALYAEACASCHGARGRPPAGALKTDFEGNWLLPTVLANGVFKGGTEGEQLYLRLLKGIGGTAMPGYEGVYGPEQLWDLVHYVELLAQPGGDPDPLPELPATVTAGDSTGPSPGHSTGSSRDQVEWDWDEEADEGGLSTRAGFLRVGLIGALAVGLLVVALRFVRSTR